MNFSIVNEPAHKCHTFFPFLNHSKNRKREIFKIFKVGPKSNHNNVIINIIIILNINKYVKLVKIEILTKIIIISIKIYLTNVFFIS